ncbi:hypothetical protein [Candidatus Amarobacter glycogenicus]|uniref:hypothetical protein n=1 Tax=Candidatus Amarobacter glycogenicus TaxID=3140699 RepID=UPI002A173068|nr:hypothetical protein [Dehalococcoidia bacterium]
MTQHVLIPKPRRISRQGAPSFGDVPLRPFEATPERLVLSSDEHSHLQPSTPINWLGGNFNHDRLGRGELRLYETTTPGEIHIEADVRQADGPSVHLDANVRESGSPAPSLATTPHRSTSASSAASSPRRDPRSVHSHNQPPGWLTRYRQSVCLRSR